MSFKKSKAFGPMLLLGAQYISKIIGPLIAILLVRYLGPEDYGLYAAAIAVTSFLTILPDFGLQQAVLKESREKNIKLANLIRIALTTSFFYTIITFLFLVSWLNIFNYEDTIKVLAIILSLSFIRLAILKVVTTLLQMQRRFTRIALWSLIINGSQWVTTIVSLLLKADLYYLIFWPQIISLLITIIILFVEGRKIDLFKIFNPKLMKNEYKVVIKNSLEFGTANSLYQVYHRSDALILSATRSPLEVGYYNVSFMVAQFIYFFAGVLFNQVLFPIFFGWSKYNRGKYLRYYRISNKIMILSGLFFASILIIFSTEIIMLIFGTQEDIAVQLLIIMMLAVPFRFLVVSVGAILTTDNLVIERIKIQSKVAIFNIGLNALLIPQFGVMVAALVMIATDIILMCAYLYAVNKNITRNHFSKRMLILLPILISLPFWGIYLSNSDFIYKVIASVFITGLFTILGLLSLEKEEIKELKSLFNKK